MAMDPPPLGGLESDLIEKLVTPSGRRSDRKRSPVSQSMLVMLTPACTGAE
jgi:hypothetical protein